MTQNDDDMDLVDRLLAEAAEATRPEPDGAFMARILADAERLQSPAPGKASAPRATARPAGALASGAGAWFGGRESGAASGWVGGWLGSLGDVFGGRAALAGMMAATVAGLYLGIAQPSVMSSLTTALYGQTPLASLDLMAGSDSLWTVSQQ